MAYVYQKRDYEYVNYKLWGIEGVPHPLRGPKPKKSTLIAPYQKCTPMHSRHCSVIFQIINCNF